MPAGRRPMQRRKERKQAKKWKEGSKKRGRNKEKVKERRKRTWWFVGFPRRMRRQIVKQLKADPSTLSRSRLEFPSESNPHNDGLKLSATFSFGREKAATRLKPTKKERKRERDRVSKESQTKNQNPFYWLHKFVQLSNKLANMKAPKPQPRPAEWERKRERDVSCKWKREQMTWFWRISARFALIYWGL